MNHLVASNFDGSHVGFNMKTCFKCGCQKLLTEFYRHSRMADGHLNKCKDCTKTDVAQHRHGKGRNRTLAYDRERAALPKRKEQQKQIVWRWRMQFPERKQAQSKLRYAVLTGEIKPQLCFVCGKIAEAHHPDYSRPLDVVWLCSAHHKQAHALVRTEYA
jgi:hypothetical protein